MLIDEVKIKLIAGHGGAGKVAFNPGRYGGPSGGNGGKGGDIYARVTSDLTALSQFAQKTEFEAEAGEAGGSNKKSGHSADGLTFEFPVGSVLTDTETGEIIELDQLGQEVLLCRGGMGGKGNFEFRSSTNTTPRYAQPGQEGQVRNSSVVLKLIADFGLIGLPNAGKSSLLNELTKADVKVASYPFTTLEPNLGVFQKRILADIPGLIEGASSGKGLGIKFLKHIEKVSLLLHCISAESEDLIQDYKTIRQELEQYDEKLSSKPEIIILTKSDLVDDEALNQRIAKLSVLKRQIIPVSIHNWESLEKLKEIF